MANTKLPSRLLDTSAIPALNVTGDLTVDTTTLKVDSTNNRVGIGIASPAQLLHIKSAAPDIRIEDSDGGYADLNGPGGSLELRADQGNAVGSSEISFWVDGGKKAVIDANGNVGIGTGTATVHGKFVVSNGGAEGFEVFPGSASGQNSFQHYNRSGSAYLRNRNIASEFTFNLSGASDDAVTFKAGGNVGIGETSPDGKLHIKGATATGDLAHILFENTQGSKVFAIGGGSTGVTNSHLYFRNVTDNTRPMVITDAGPIGIGTDSPYSGSKLTVQTDQSDAYSATGFNSGSLLRIVSVNANTNYSSIAFSNVGGNYEHFIGAVQTSANTADIVFQGYDRAASAYKEYLRITDGGNVGIGIPAAAAKLDVSAPATDRETIRLSTYYSPVDSLARGGITWHDGANITGQIDTRYDGSTVDMHIGSLYSGGYNTSTKMIVKGNGAVQTPLQPSCNVYHNTASMSIAAGSKFIFNVVGHNVANLYDTTTGRITAPVAGTYLLTFNTIFQGSYSNAYFQFYLNNARSYVLGDYHLSANPSASAHWQTHQYSKVVYLAKTDYIEVFARTAMTWHGTHWGGLSCHLL